MHATTQGFYRINLTIHTIVWVFCLSKSSGREGKSGIEMGRAATGWPCSAKRTDCRGPGHASRPPQRHTAHHSAGNAAASGRLFPGLRGSLCACSRALGRSVPALAMTGREAGGHRIAPTYNIYANAPGLDGRTKPGYTRDRKRRCPSPVSPVALL